MQTNKKPEDFYDNKRDIASLFALGGFVVLIFTNQWEIGLGMVIIATAMHFWNKNDRNGNAPAINQKTFDFM